MFCRECGHQLKGNEDFCPMCGTKVVKDPETYYLPHEDLKDHEQHEESGLPGEKEITVHENEHSADDRSGNIGETGEESMEAETAPNSLGDFLSKYDSAMVQQEQSENAMESQEKGGIRTDGQTAPEDYGSVFFPAVSEEQHPAVSQQAKEPEPAFSQDYDDRPNLAVKEKKPAKAAAAGKKTPARKASRKEILLAAGIPAASLLLFTGTAFGMAASEKTTNQKAESLHYEGEEYALNGDYTEAVEKLSKASELRPENSTIKKVKVEVESAKKAEEKLKAIDQNIKEKQFGKAKDSLNALRNELQTRDSGIFSPLTARIADEESNLVIEMVKTETAEMNTVDEIGEQLKKVYKLENAEAEEVKGQLIKKIVSLCMTDSENFMKEKNFDAAISSLRSGMRYTNYENVELTSRLNKLEDAKLKYEDSLPVFLEKHWVKIDAKAMTSKTPPVKLGKIVFEEDQFSYVVKGRFANQTKNTLNNPTLYLKIYDKNGKFLFNEEVPSNEVSIEGGKVAEFFFILDKEYGKELKIVIDQVKYRK